MTSLAANEWDLDPLVRQAHRDSGRSWVRIVITVVASGFLLLLVGIAEAIAWLVVLLGVEAATALLRKSLRAGDLRFREAYAPLLFANATCWVVHALLLWAQPEEVAKIAALFDLFTASLYAAVGGGANRRLMLALLLPPIVALPTIVITYAWLQWTLPIAIISTLSMLGACVLIVVNAIAQNRTEQRVLATVARLAATNRAKDAFIADMSHEVRTPLNGVLALAGALERTQLDPAQREMVGLIRSSGDTLRRLVSGVLDLAKIDAGQIEVAAAPFDMGTCVEAAVLPMRAVADEKGISLSLDIEPSARGAYLGDALRIGQIVANLVANAVKFTSVGGVTVHLRADADDQTGVKFELSVRDTGPGLTAEMRARLFKRFSQLDGESISETGTGLGLAISMALARLMGGDIAVSSTVGLGSEFTLRVRLPKADALDGADQALSALRQPVLRNGKISILVAEDHAVSRRAMEMILLSASAEVRTVENGRDAVDAFARGHFDLVLMDKRMPEMDGLDATRAIRQMEAAQGRPPTPILMLSADASQRDLDIALAAGCSGHLAKPVTPESLFAAIDDVMAE